MATGHPWIVVALIGIAFSAAGFIGLLALAWSQTVGVGRQRRRRADHRRALIARHDRLLDVWEPADDGDGCSSRTRAARGAAADARRRVDGLTADGRRRQSRVTVDDVFGPELAEYARALDDLARSRIRVVSDRPDEEEQQS